jgi:streptogramin lyase
MAAGRAEWVGSDDLVSEAAEFAVPIAHAPDTPGVNQDLGAVLIGTGVSSTGQVWFTESNSGKVGKITPDGEVTQFLLADPPNSPHRLTAGADGTMWFTNFQGNAVGHITPDGAVTEYPVLSAPTHSLDEIAKAAGASGKEWFSTANNPAPSSSPFGITHAADGTVWFTQFKGNRIGCVREGGQVKDWDVPTPVAGPVGVAVGDDGNIWFVEHFVNKIGRMTPSGEFSEFDIPTAKQSPYHVVAGPDGALWFTISSNDSIGRITPDGEITEFSVGDGTPRRPMELTVGPDGALWFTELVGSAIGRLTTDGKVSHFPCATAKSAPFTLVFDHDGVLWYSSMANDSVGRIKFARAGAADGPSA